MINKKPSLIPKLVFLFIGIVSCIWFIIRVIPKPSRATYPCQRIAFPIASSFVIWLMGIFASFALFKNSSKMLMKREFATTFFALTTSVMFVIFSFYTKNPEIKNPGLDGTVIRENGIFNLKIDVQPNNKEAFNMTADTIKDEVPGIFLMIGD